MLKALFPTALVLALLTSSIPTEKVSSALSQLPNKWFRTCPWMKKLAKCSCQTFAIGKQKVNQLPQASQNE